MNKYIKLEDAIEAVYQGRRKPVDDEWIRILEALNAMPSADVVEREALNEFMEKYDDLKIRHKEALNYVPWDFEKRFEDYDMAVDIVNDKPKVNPELRADLLKRLYVAKCKEVEKLKAVRKNGKWNWGDFSCSECGVIIGDIWLKGCTYEEQFNFCPKCGADMRGVE